jgi:diaminopimelate epimerase
VTFEKWQALGNDYLVVEQPVDADTVRRLCDRHTGVGADGVLVLSRSETPGFVARLRIFNPDGSEAELSGNGAREALMYLHRHGWAKGRQFSIETIAGEIRATVHDERTCTVDMGRARLGIEGEVEGFRFQQVLVGNPQCAIRVASVEELDRLDLPAIGPGIEHHELFAPARTNVSWWTELGPAVIRARIFERGVGETMSSGTGATGAAIAHVLRGGDSPVTVRLDGGELEVDVGEDLHVDLTGWAVPVFRGELAA